MEKNPFVSLKAFEEAKAYWLSRLSGELKEIRLPADFAGQKVYRPAELRVDFGQEITENLVRMGKSNDLSIYILLLTTLKILIFKMTGENDIIVTSPTRGDNIRKYNRFVAFRDVVYPDMTFRDFLMRVKETVIDGYRNQHYPIKKLVEFLDPGSEVLFFKIILMLENIHQPEAADDPAVDFENDVTFSFRRADAELPGTVIYNSALFTEDRVGKLFERYRHVLAQIIRDKTIDIAGIELISQGEKREILDNFNNTNIDFPVEQTVHDRFAEQVKRARHHVAVVYGDRQLTYGELDTRANRLARLLRLRGVKTDVLVGIKAERSPRMITGILAVLKAGGGYLPLDPHYPTDRVQFMLADSGVEIVLSDHEDRLSELVINGGIDAEFTIREEESSLSSLAYMIYTSGSTGQPKGTLVAHRSLVNLCCWHNRCYGVTASDRTAQYADSGFDASVWEIFPYLVTGAVLHLIPDDIKIDIHCLADYYIKNRITIAFLPTQFCQQFMEEIGDIPRLRVLLTGGDKLSRFTRRSYRLVNNYGPTENTVVTTSFPVEVHQENIPIGKPIDNVQVFILDKGGLGLQPVGIPGELCIAGDGLARGYLNQPELTAEKFVNLAAKSREDTRSFTHQPPNPKSYILNPKSQILYKTGDLAAWLPGGTIGFLGRIDNQVKIRGYRIELGEIESRLAAHPEVKEAVVVTREVLGGEKRLAAYFVPSGRGPLDPQAAAAELRAYLSKTMPDYMIPSYFMQLEGFPLTANGKIDKRALPEYEAGSFDEYVAPRDRVEERLVGLWSGVLGVDEESIGIDANFFELGGHSLNANIAAARIHREFDVKISLGEIFETPTIRGLAEYIKRAAGDRYICIDAVEKKEYYPLSSAQKRLFILQQMGLENVNYNIPAAFILEGDLDREKLEQTFSRLIRRHESLRTSFETIDGEAVQRVHGAVEFRIEYKEQETVNDFIRPFDLGQAPLLRVGLAHTPAPGHPSQEGRYVLMIDMHHIVSDGTSVGVIIGDFMALYGGEELSRLRIHYKDFSLWQEREKAADSLKLQEEYWLNQFEGEVPVLNLPTDYPRPPVQSFSGRSLTFEWAETETTALKGLASAEDVTLFMVLLAVYTIFLARLGGWEDIVVGTPVAGRGHADLQQIVGMFVNTLGLRNFPVGRKSCRQFLKEVKERTVAAFENQEYQFEDLVEKVAAPRDAGRNPLFDVMFGLQNVDIPEIGIPGLRSRPYEYDNRVAKFDLNVMAVEAKGKLFFVVSYCTALFESATIERFIRYFKNTLSAVIEDVEVKISAVSMIPEAEKTALLYDFNDTECAFPHTRTIHHLFAEQAGRTPGSTALVYEESILTYGELNRLSDSWAGVLRQEGVFADHIVGIMLERSMALIIGILSILKAGAAYLPLDPRYPEPRIHYMLADSGAGMVITDHPDRLPPSVNGFSPLALNRRQDSSCMIQAGHPGPDQGAGPANPAYVIYTSGTTGRPKGVLVSHRSLVNLIAFQEREFAIAAGDRILQFSAITFDASVEQVFSALTGGAVLVLVSRSVLLEGSQFERYINTHQINHIHAVPSFLDHLKIPGPCRHLKRVLSGGDVCPVRLARKWGTRCAFYNKYGPSETTITSIEARIDHPSEALHRLPIGRPIGNTRIYILDRGRELVPLGVPGELYIGGTGVSRGYLNNPELTADKFVNVAAKSREGTRSSKDEILTPKSQILYRTGDMGRFLPDGNIEFLGRIDHQVKIRGFRIELAEIESRLLAHADIKEAVVTTRGDGSDNQYLAAYIVSPPTSETSPTELRQYLAASLPDYMIPSFFVPLERIPLTASGKVDRKSLPEPDTTLTGHIPPRDGLELKLTQLWAEVLALASDRVSINANFFESGGHSLKAMLLAARIHRELDVKVPLAEIFKTPSIEGLSAYIKKAKPDRFAPLKPAETKEYYPLSSAQKRLYILQQLDRKSTAYNVPGILELEGKFDRAHLEGVFRRLIERHESLRSAIVLRQNVPVQRVYRQVAFGLEYYESGEGGRREPLEDSIGEFIRAFDLLRAPLLRVGLIELTHPSQEGRYVLVVDMHHIVSDGISMGLFISEFMSLYGGKELPPLRLHYRDYSEWQNRQKGSETLKQQEAYWLGQFDGDLPVVNLPTDFPRPWLKSFAGDVLTFEIGQKDTAALRSLAYSEGSTLFMPLLSVFNILLSRLCGLEDIIVGTPTAGRPHADLQQIVGMFVNTLALRNFPSAEKPFREFSREVRDRTLLAFENQAYQFEDLVEKAAISRDASRNPLFDFVFALQNMDMPEIEIPGLRLKPFGYNYKISKFDLTLMGVEDGERLVFTVEYAAKLFTEATIDRFVGYFKEAVSAVLEDPDRQIKDIEIVPAGERRHILHDFNDTATDYRGEMTLHRLFEAKAAQTPDRIAVVGSRLASAPAGAAEFVSYRALNEGANRLAWSLLVGGMRPDTPVGIIIERSLEMALAVLGVMKSGGAYLPIEPSYPVGRIDYILQDSGLDILIHNRKSYRSRIPLEIDMREAGPFADGNGSNPTVESGPGQAAYIIYTSGTTGRPKGVMVDHGSVVNTLVCRREEYRLDGRAVCLQLFSYAFDGFVTSFFTPIVSGAKVVILAEEALKDIPRLTGTIARLGVTHMICVPVLFQAIIENIKEAAGLPLKVVTLAGDTLPAGLVERTRQENANMEIAHEYGVSEGAVMSTLLRHQEREERIMIGRPVWNTAVYIVDRFDRPLPLGVWGQLCIGGRGLARGYLNNPELTADKFMNLAAKAREGARSSKDEILTPKSYILYRTGDVARFLPDGNLEFSGRLDNQVKLRGYRIETAEIEAQLLRHGDIKESLVVLREDRPGDRQLVAYVVPRDSRTIDTSSCRQFLAQFLPDYMIPAHVVNIDKIPLTAVGKVDRQALPLPESSRPQLRQAYVAPETEVQKTIAAVWLEVLNLERVGVDDNYFDLGGNSLNIIQVNNRLNELFEDRLPVMVMFRYPTIRSLAGFLGRQETDGNLERSRRSQALKRGKDDRRQRLQKRKQIKRGGM
jgi:tyrocidine synthetase-3